MELTKEQSDEIERCRREPWYFYNQYFIHEGKKQITEDEYWEYLAAVKLLSFKPRYPSSKASLIKEIAKQLKQQHHENRT